MNTNKRILFIQILIHSYLFYYLSQKGLSFNKFLVYSVPYYFFVSRIGNDIGYHRLFCHGSFNAPPLVQNILLILGALDLKGSSIGWATLHSSHHKYADTDKDPHNGSNVRNILKNWILAYNIEDIRITKELSGLSSSKVHRLLHRHYFILVCLATLTMYFIFSKEVFFYTFIIGSAWSFHASATINIFCHLFGYRNFHTADNSYNNFIVHIFTLGGGLHNNHHARPKNYYLSVKKFEWDINGWLIRVFIEKNLFFARYKK